jgi:hypothetical protein
MVVLLLSTVVYNVTWTATQTITYPSGLVYTYIYGAISIPEFDISVDAMYHFACSPTSAHMYKRGGSTYSLLWSSNLGGIFGTPSNCKVVSDVDMATKYLTITIKKDGTN